jgi:hypothetical protein
MTPQFDTSIFDHRLARPTSSHDVAAFQSRPAEFQKKGTNTVTSTLLEQQAHNLPFQEPTLTFLGEPRRTMTWRRACVGRG